LGKNTYKADVVVIGAGLAGVVTALELLDAGRRVVLLDRAPQARLGGLARLSFGGLFFVDSPEQRRSGIRDSVALALSDWLAYGELGPDDIWPRRWAEAYVHRVTPDVRDWLHARGVRFFPAVNWTERGWFVPGNSVPRFHLAWGCGEGVVAPLAARLDGHPHRDNLQLCFDHRVDDLIVTNGRFTGCHGVHGTEEFEAHGDAVVLSCGGIAGKLEQVRKHWAPSLGTPPEVLLNGSHEEADGALIEAAQRLGANVTHLEKMWNYAAGVRHWRPRFENDGLSLVPGKSALWLDWRGRRFTDPPLVGSYDTLALIERICREEKKYSWQVLNYRIAKRELAVSGAEFNPTLRDHRLAAFLLRLLLGDRKMVDDFVQHCPDFVTADTVPGLAAKMNALAGSEDVDAEALADTIARYDANVARGKAYHNDDQLRRVAHARRYRGDRLRTCNNARILDPRSLPLIAIRLSIITRKSLGGIVVDDEARVLAPDDRRLDGLYAVGEACGFGGGGMHGKRALEGTFLGGCVFSGRAAAGSIVSGRGLA
jgi:predicted oxidoreductase